MGLNYCNNTARAAQAFLEFQQAGGKGALARADVTQAAQVDKLVRNLTQVLGFVNGQNLAVNGGLTVA